MSFTVEKKKNHESQFHPRQTYSVSVILQFEHINHELLVQYELELNCKISQIIQCMLILKKEILTSNAHFSDRPGL